MWNHMHQAATDACGMVLVIYVCRCVTITATKLELHSRSVLDRRHYSHRVLHLNMGGVNLKGGHNLILEIQIPANGGMLTAPYAFHGRDVSRALLGLTSLFVIINAVSSFQIDGMPMFDLIESKYTSRMKRACPWWPRSLFRATFGYVWFFVYPCFLWLKIKKPKMMSSLVAETGVFGVVGMLLGGASIAAEFML
ncbi:Lysine histidine transporter-like 8 [Vitis vinifera]|uniref:Lysine histidine transporter-like 8 n=1 Tax=Vitis vinifera TaxID=29760 RepID=A0A438EVG1_VITVI|nr:Lysine histidine transporter-like 8 [Vitis vinifera]